MEKTHHAHTKNKAGKSLHFVQAALQTLNLGQGFDRWPCNAESYERNLSIEPWPIGTAGLLEFSSKNRSKEWKATCTYQLRESATASILQVCWDTCPGIFVTSTHDKRKENKGRSRALANEENTIESKMWFAFVKSLNWLGWEISLRPLIKVSLQLSRNIQLFSSIQSTLARQQTFRPLQETQSYRKGIHEMS